MSESNRPKPPTRDELTEALNWIEGHKKKSGYHDKILYALNAASSLSLVSNPAFGTWGPFVGAVFFAVVSVMIWSANK